MILKIGYSITMLVILSSCAKPNAEQVASNNGFTQKFIQTQPFNLASYQKILQPGSPVTIYIEGDGYAWIRNIRLSTDPTPRTPLVIQLAAVDPSPNVVYLARPCQYSPADLNAICESKYWSQARYSSTVIKSMDQAITKIKNLSQAKKLKLVGFSGGAAIAILVAAQRTDIESIRTIAGNLDLIAMQEYHHSSPLSESLDPLDFAKQTSKIPQLHFIGKKDNVVPNNVARNFCSKAGLDSKHIIVLNSVGHNKGWLENWPNLLKYIP